MTKQVGAVARADGKQVIAAMESGRMGNGYKIRDTWHPDMGTRWLHVWIDQFPDSRDVLVWWQFETAGVSIGAPSCQVMPPSAAEQLFEKLSLCRPVRHDRASLSIHLG